jgi:hypothetical protein
MSTGTEKKPSIEAQADQTYIQVEAGIYRYKDKGRRITYHKPISSLRERNIHDNTRLY